MKRGENTLTRGKCIISCGRLLERIQDWRNEAARLRKPLRPDLDSRSAFPNSSLYNYYAAVIHNICKFRDS